MSDHIRRIEARAKQHIAEKCYLYRWESYRGQLVKDGKSAFSASSGVVGLSDERMNECLGHAMARWNKWIVAVHACFVTPDGEYYEEARECVSLPVRLGHDDSEKVALHNETIDVKNNLGQKHSDEYFMSVEDLDDVISGMVKDAKESGNQDHYLDAVAVLRLKTPAFERMADDDEWCKKQTMHRRRQILETLA